MPPRRKKKQLAQNSPESPRATGQGRAPSPLLQLSRHFLKRSVLTVAVIILVGLVCYSNTFDAQFHFDDQKSIVDNPSIRDLANLKAIWKYSPIRFVTYLSFAVNYHFGQLNVFGYHIVNIVIHIATALLVYLYIYYISILSKKREPYWIAVFAALIFLCHPIQTQAVTYIVQRAASLATLFYMLSLTCYVKARILFEGASTGSLDEIQHVGIHNGVGSQPAIVRRGRFLVALAASIAAALLAVFSKEIAFTLPVSIAMIEIFFFHAGWMKRAKVWLALLPLLLGSIFLLGPTLWKRITHFETVGELLRISRYDYLLTQVKVVCTYIRLLFLPIYQNLDYDYPITRSFLDFHLWFSAMILLAIVILGVVLYRRDRLISFGIFFFFITLSIESSVIPIMDVIFEHRLYLPLVGFSIVISTVYFQYIYIFILRRATSHLGFIMAYCMPVLLLVVLSIFTFQRNFIWHDGISLWTDVIGKSPQKFRGYYNLGNAYRRNNMLDIASQYYEKSIELNRSYYRSYDGLSYIYSQKKRFDLAKEYCMQSLNINPQNHEILNRLGYIFLQTGDPVSGIEYFKKAYRINNSDITIIKNLALANAIFKDYKDSIIILKKYLASHPTAADAHYLLATNYYEDQNYSQAKHHCNLAIQYGHPVPAAFLEALEGHPVKQP
jgi:protein O-mannosyl-transferase